MYHFSFVASGIDPRCDSTRDAFKEHGASLYACALGKALLDFSVNKPATKTAIEKAISLVESKGGIVEQVWTPTIQL